MVTPTHLSSRFLLLPRKYKESHKHDRSFPVGSFEATYLIDLQRKNEMKTCIIIKVREVSS